MSCSDCLLPCLLQGGDNDSDSDADAKIRAARSAAVTARREMRQATARHRAEAAEASRAASARLGDARREAATARVERDAARADATAVRTELRRAAAGRALPLPAPLLAPVATQPHEGPPSFGFMAGGEAVRLCAAARIQRAWRARRARQARSGSGEAKGMLIVAGGDDDGAPGAELVALRAEFARQRSAVATVARRGASADLVDPAGAPGTAHSLSRGAVAAWAALADAASEGTTFH